MKGKRYTTEDKIRILREADSGKSILEVCREHNLSQTSFHRWKRQLGQMEVSDARKLEGAGARERGAQEDARRSPAQKPGAGGGMRKKL
jgi:transposase-like protein